MLIGIAVIIAIWAGGRIVLEVIIFATILNLIIGKLMDLYLSMPPSRNAQEWLQGFSDRATTASCHLLYAPTGWVVATVLGSIALSQLPSEVAVWVSVAYVVIASTLVNVEIKLEQISSKQWEEKFRSLRARQF